MSPGSSAPSAFQAALAGVSHGFATRRASRTCQHAEQPPPTGSDSSYGVRSLNSSVEWDTHDPADDQSESSDASDASPSPPRNAREQDDADADERVSGGSEDLFDSDSFPSQSITPSAPVVSLPPLRRSSTGETLMPRHAGAGRRTAADDTTGAGAPITPPAAEDIPLAPAPPPTPRSPLLPREETPTPPAMLLAASEPERDEHTPSPSVSRERYSYRERERERERVPPLASHALLDMLADAPSASEPSSPASLESFPSCIASMSSLSRTSSPSDWDWRHPLSRSLVAADVAHGDDRQSLSGLGLGEGHQSAELVLPTLSLPSTSLHLGLERWPGLPAGTRIALLASPEKTRDVLGALAMRQPCVQLAHGAVGIMKDGALVATILTGHSVDNARQRTTEAYTALHSLLNPSPTAEQRRELEPMVASYSSRADWVHLVVNLNDADCADLSTVVPVTSLDAEAQRLAAEHAEEAEREAALAEAAKEHLGDSATSDEDEATAEKPVEAEDDAPTASPTPSPTASQPRPSLNRSSSSTRMSASGPHDTDITPRAVPDNGEFHFPAPLPLVPETEDDMAGSVTTPLTQDVEDAVALLEHALDDPERIQSASFEHFFNWRPRRPLAVPSPLALSPASSTFDGAASPAPLPTVTRASGEWEATLSRRLAHRRELDASARRSRQPAAVPIPSMDMSRRSRRRRRPSHSPKAESCGPGPLFPRRHISTAELGLADLFARVFAPVKGVLERTSWTHMVFACAIAFAVGCGFWAARA